MPPVISKGPPELLCRGISLLFGLFVANFGCGIKLPRVGKVDVYRVICSFSFWAASSEQRSFNEMEHLSVSARLFPERPGNSWVHVTYGNLQLTCGWILQICLFFSLPPSSKMFYNSYNTLSQLCHRFLGTCDLQKFAVNLCSVLCLFDVSYLVILKCKKNPGTWAWPQLESE